MNATGSLPLTLGEIRLCERVLDNLIENAVLYTGKDGFIGVSAELNDENERIEVQVTDNGSGIHPENIARLFDCSSRLQREGPEDAERAGLGLAIVKRILKLQGAISG
jgi:signal transduction histidine kinase